MGMQTSRIFPVQESKNAFARSIRTLVAQSKGEGTDLPLQGFSTLIHTARRGFSYAIACIFSVMLRKFFRRGETTPAKIMLA